MVAVLNWSASPHFVRMVRGDDFSITFAFRLNRLVSEVKSLISKSTAWGSLPPRCRITLESKFEELGPYQIAQYP